MQKIILGDCLEELPKLPDKFASLIVIDPPYNSNKVQKRQRIKTIQVDNGGDRIGFGGKQFKTVKLAGTPSYNDKFDNFQEFLMPRIRASLHCLKDNASIFIFLDWREVHYIKVAMDALLGRDHFMNELIWCFDYGAKPKKFWPRKHNTILWYVLDPKNYIFNYDQIERIPYMAPGMVSKEKAEKGKIPCDWFFQTIVPTNGKEKANFPTQKPLAILNKIIKVHSNPEDTVLDFFMGSGTTGVSAKNNGRGFVLIDKNPAAIEICKRRLT